MLRNIRSFCGVVQRAHQVIVPVDVHFRLVAHDHLGATILRKQHDVADLDQHWACLSVFEGLARTDCEHSAEVELLLFA